MSLISALRKKALRASIAKAKIQRRKLSKQKDEAEDIEMLRMRLAKVNKSRLSPAQKMDLERRKKAASARKRAVVKAARVTGKALNATFKFLEKNTRGADSVAFGMPKKVKRKKR